MRSSEFGSFNPDNISGNESIRTNLLDNLDKSPIEIQARVYETLIQKAR